MLHLFIEYRQQGANVDVVVTREQFVDFLFKVIGSIENWRTGSTCVGFSNKEDGRDFAEVGPIACL